jgi:basic membrane protein A and related proteins
MKKYLSFLISLLLVSSLVLSACGKSDSSDDKGKSGEEGKDKLKVAFYVNGTLGDKGFFDSAQRGLEQAERELGIELKTVEGGYNQSDWAAGLEQLVSGGKYDVIVVGTSQMKDITIDIANRYPDQKFIYFDEKIEGVPNIYSMLYSQSEGSFLAGAFAALVTTSTELKNANPDKIIGFVGGMDIPIINDFLAGYEQGAKYIDPDIKVIASYVGDFENAPKAKEFGLSQFNTQKVDVSFNVAGGAGLGLLEAAKEANKYAIGVDSNQNPLYPGTVLTSMLKNIDKSLVRALDLHIKGELEYGKTEVLGIPEDGVGLAKDDLYEQHVPQSIKDKIKEIEEKLAKGEIKVDSILD